MGLFSLWAQQVTHSPWAAAGFGIAMFFTAVFLILLVLVQRGRGGGLAGAFGGMGGQSAFGAKAGDTFTKVTIYASTFWILLCMAALKILNPAPNVADASNEPTIDAIGDDGASTDAEALDGAVTDGVDDSDGAAVDGTPVDGAETDGNATDGADADGDDDISVGDETDAGTGADNPAETDENE